MKSGADELYITRQDYAEQGGDFVREHRWGNRYFATPAPIVVVDQTTTATTKTETV